MKLRKWEIKVLEDALKEPMKERWRICPFRSLECYKKWRYKRHCQRICRSLFARCRDDVDGLVPCPASCLWEGRYSDQHISRVVRKLLKEQKGMNK